MQMKLSHHARERMQQRGSRRGEVALVLAHADIEVPAGDGCRFLRLSNRAVAGLFESATASVQDVERARRLVLLVSRDDRVVTLLKNDPDRRLRGRPVR